MLLKGWVGPLSLADHEPKDVAELARFKEVLTRRSGPRREVLDRGMVGRDYFEEISGPEPAELFARALKRERTRQAPQIKVVRERHSHDPRLGSFLGYR